MNLNDLSPYGSYLLLQEVPGVGASGDLEALTWQLLRAHILQQGASHGTKINIGKSTPSTGLNIAAYRFVERRPSSWARVTAALADSLNQAVIIGRKHGLAALCFSDASHKQVVWRAARDGGLPRWRPVQHDVLVRSFVSGHPLRTLWLSGTHRTVSIKPDSKVLSGVDLRDAIDPLGDSTYWPGAVRSKEGGVSLQRSGVWLGKNSDWSTLVGQVDRLIDAVHNNIVNPTINTSLVHPALAETVSSISGADNAYHFEIVSPDTLHDNGLRDSAESLSLEFDIVLVAAGVPKTRREDFQLDVTWIDNGVPQSGSLYVNPVLNGLVSFNVTSLGAASPVRLVDFLESSPELFRVFYDTGETIAGGQLSKSLTQDRPFSDWKWCDFGMTPGLPSTSWHDVSMEKPLGKPPQFSNIWMDPTEKSLFAWFVRHGLAQLNLDRPNGAAQCWLYCDDDSMEVADFIHIKATPGQTPSITLIHVKGASSESAIRRVAAGPYELVIAQAMKNLRAIDSKSLLKRIEHRMKRGGRIWDAPWSLRVAPCGSDVALTAALQGIKTQCDYGVIVVQPHVLKSNMIVNAAGDQSQTAGAIQLRSLLFGLRTMAAAVNARLIVVGDKR